ncbi:hypothetical protein GCM10007418_15390 [Halopseudomonas salina]|uniref:Uncharacterized protein n=1 Tax=Halopseudomonas salina TaxID=1323744 RepID=A0ABQ1PGV6_9GAMM|nr:hypothetical protein GCM10007418_15390 [Halopseudomonas salina]
MRGNDEIQPPSSPQTHANLPTNIIPVNSRQLPPQTSSSRTRGSIFGFIESGFVPDVTGLGAGCVKVKMDSRLRENDERGVRGNDEGGARMTREVCAGMTGV